MSSEKNRLSRLFGKDLKPLDSSHLSSFTKNTKIENIYRIQYKNKVEDPKALA
jgi:hypothetical protein